MSPGANPIGEILREMSQHRAGPNITVLPDSPDVILIEDAIVADDGNVFELSLGNQHPVERVPMLSRQPASPQSVLQRYRQWLNAQLT